MHHGCWCPWWLTTTSGGCLPSHECRDAAIFCLLVDCGLLLAEVTKLRVVETEPVLVVAGDARVKRLRQGQTGGLTSRDHPLFV
jgi:hypothetical protein